MKILAVADIEDKSLESVIDSGSDKLKGINYIFSCGDLPKKYLEYLTDGLHKSLYFVSGNHFSAQFYGDNFKKTRVRRKVYRGKGMRHRHGGIDMHGRVEVVGDYILVGFGGSMRYNPGNFQFEEYEMEKLVKKAIAAIKCHRLLDFILFKKKKQIIVISHAPVEGIHDKEDRCHKGFKCFKRFVQYMKPLLWLHGHIHPEGQLKDQQTRLDQTLIVNVVPSKTVEISNCEIIVKQVFSS